MARVACRVLFAAIVAALVAYVFVTSAQLPDPVASKFDADGKAIAYMSRDVYRMFMAGATLLVPLVLLVFLAWLPHIKPRFINIPNRDYWLAPERREETLSFLERHALVLGCGSALFFAGMHRLTAQAKSLVPPQLDNPPFLLMTGLFVAGVIVAVIALGLRRA